MQIVRPGTTIDFIGKRKPLAALSILMVGASLFFALFGSINSDFPFAPKYGVDFSGGTEIHVLVPTGIDIAAIRQGLAGIGLNDDNVQSFGTEGTEFLIRVENINFGADEFFEKVKQRLLADDGEAAWARFDWNPGQSVHMTVVSVEPQDISALAARLQAMSPDVTVLESKVDHNAYEISYPGLTDKVKSQLATVLGTDQAGEPAFEVISVEMVGPAVGAELRRKGMLSIVLSLALILIYVAFRFDLAFAPGAVVALLHDVLFTVGVFCVLGREFTLPTIGALLTIVGYSLNDTIVVYDRIRENLIRFPRRDLAEVINISLNETLSRTVLTSVTTILAVTSLMVWGGPILRDFALALFVGVLIGTYSSIYVASPLILSLQKWLPVDVQSTEDSRERGRAAANHGARL